MRPGPTFYSSRIFASAELGVYRALGWDIPPRILDLYAEFRVRTNGLPTPAGRGLLGALAYFGCDTVGATKKQDMQQPSAMAHGATGTAGTRS